MDMASKHTYVHTYIHMFCCFNMGHKKSNIMVVFEKCPFLVYDLVHNFELLWCIPSSRMWDNNNVQYTFGVLTYLHFLKESLIKVNKLIFFLLKISHSDITTESFLHLKNIILIGLVVGFSCKKVTVFTRQADRICHTFDEGNQVGRQQICHLGLMRITFVLVSSFHPSPLHCSIKFQ